jgi:hypothetical protein
LSNFKGNPPNCRPECTNNNDCPNQLTCIKQKCKNPCSDSCGINANCNVINHIAICSCKLEYIGDPFTQCSPILSEMNTKYNWLIFNILLIFNSNNFLIFLVMEKIKPCSPTPCGANAMCKEQNNIGSCTCLPNYFGNPYEGCRPECIINSDCQANLVCIQNKCKDPCPGSCGQNALCQVVNHSPLCTCIEDYTGNPFSHCTLKQIRKII